MVAVARDSSSADTLLHAADGNGHVAGGGQASRNTGANTLQSQKSSGYGASGSGQQMAPGTVLAGRYRVVAPIGRGGMGQVYRAEDLKLGETVALKFLPENLAQDAAWLGRFFMEVRTAREVTHANVCRVHDVVETTDGSGRPLYFLTMEYVDGENLADLIKRFGRLPTEKGMEIAGQITAALAAAHEKGVLHRDIKPANVMIDGRGQAKLADFGLAVANGSVEAAEVAGTPGYIAPEILRNGTATGRSDLYSLGLVLYELLTGRKAVKDGKAVTGSVREYAPEVPAAAEKVVLQCMDADPAKRPASAMEVLRAFPAKNALEAALARGETPSPEMVANSADDTPMRLPVAWSMVGATCLLLFLTWFATGHGGFQAVKPPQLSPDEMRGRAQQWMRDLGFPVKGTVQQFHLIANYALLDFYTENGTPQQKRDFAHSPQGSVLADYWQAQTTNLLSYNGLGWSYNSADFIGVVDPAGSEHAVVDSDGNLLNFSAEPQSFSATGAAATGPDTTDWDGLLRATGLDAKSVVAVAPAFTPPYAFDDRREWTGSYPARPDLQVRVQGASWHGRLTSFAVVAPWNEQSIPVITHVQDTFLALADLSTFLLALGLAIYNLRKKRGDQRSAIRIAIFLLGLEVLVWLVGVPLASHSPGDYITAFTRALGEALASALTLGMIYIAVEPLTRKRLPRLLVASTLVLQGRWRSVTVGREILLGTVLGMFTELWYEAMHALQWGRWPGATLDVFGVNSLLGGRQTIAATLGMAIFQPSYIAELAVVFTAGLFLFRNRYVAAFLMMSVVLVSANVRGSVWSAIFICGALMGTCAYMFLRQGIVALVTSSLVSNMADGCAWPHDLSSWMAPEMALTVAAILAIAAFGFWLAIGEQRPFGLLSLED